VIVDSTHKKWCIITFVLFGISTILYIIYARMSPNGPTGGSWPGLSFGVAGSVFMLFAGALSIRKKLPRREIGTAQTWLRAHIWLGLLSVPLILFHSGFRFGGLLEQVLMLVFGLIITSGVVGVGLQHFLPRYLKTSLPASTMYQQIPLVRERLRQTADERIRVTCGELFVPAGGGSDQPDWQFEAKCRLRDFYLEVVRPYLSDDKHAVLSDEKHPVSLRTVSSANAKFAVMRESLPESDAGELHQLLSELVSVCDERRQLDLQVRLHRWLHGWLFMHVPLSCSLLVLGIVHAFMSLYY